MTEPFDVNYCQYKLPCELCMLTNSPCPYAKTYDNIIETGNKIICDNGGKLWRIKSILNSQTLKAHSIRCDKQLYPHHGLLSVQRCEEFGIELSQTERVSILLHMAGAWWNEEDVAALTDDDRQWISNHFDILAAVQWADMKAC